MSQGTLSKPHPTPKLSLDEWFDLPEDQPGELVEGRLEEEEVPAYLHELLVSLLIQILGPWITPRGGLVAGSNAKFAVGARRGRKPDLTVYLPGSRRPPARGLSPRSARTSAPGTGFPAPSTTSPTIPVPAEKPATARTSRTADNRRTAASLVLDMVGTLPVEPLSKVDSRCSALGERIPVA